MCSSSRIFETIDQYNSEFYELCGVLNSQGSFQSMYSDIFPSLGSWYQFFVLGPCKVMVSLEMFIYMKRMCMCDVCVLCNTVCEGYSLGCSG